MSMTVCNVPQFSVRTFYLKYFRMRLFQKSPHTKPVHMARVGNKVVAAAVTVFIAASFSYPFYLRKQRADKGLNKVGAEGPLPKSAVQRGVYLNTSSRDIGPDPDYKPPSRVWMIVYV